MICHSFNWCLILSESFEHCILGWFLSHCNQPPVFSLCILFPPGSMEKSSSLPLSPISIKPEQPSHRDYVITTRLGVGTIGNPIELCTNHFNVSVRQPDVVFYQYTVRLISRFSEFFYQCLCVYEMLDIFCFLCRLVSPQKTVMMSMGKE